MATFTLDWFNRYVTPQPKPIRHPFYKESVKKHERIAVHAKGKMPRELITERRPSESKFIHEYREKIYVPVTQSTFMKVYNSLMKIRKSQDWSIKMGNEPNSIRPGEGLFEYIMEKFPKFTSLTNWYFQIALKQQLIDTNAKVLVMPISLAVPDNDFKQPYPFIYNSELIIDYKYNDFYVLKSSEQIEFTESGQRLPGDRYYVVTTTHIQAFDQISSDKKFKLAFSYQHGLSYIPVYDFKGIIMDETYYQTLYDSKIMGMIPFLDEYAREYSDIQAEVVMHIHSMMWAHQTMDCKHCQGTGLAKKQDNVKVKTPCTHCGGHGTVPINPYEILKVRKQGADELPIPMPPMGYIEKSTEIVKVQKERIDAHIYAALSAINMEFLAKTPMVESGIAKAYDREETNNFVHGIAEDGVELLDNIVRCMADYRYGGMLSDEKRKAILPVINVPEKFDLLGDALLLEGITAMKNAKVDPAIVNAAEIEYAAKRFNADLTVKDLVSMKLSLDPFAGVSDEEIGLRLMNGLVSKLDAVVHANIHPFIERAMEEDKKFIGLKKSEQIAKLREFAQELLDAAEVMEPEPQEEPEEEPAEGSE